MAIALYLSGGVSNTNPELSLGGAKSSEQAGTDLVGAFTAAEFAAGTVVYRCVYVVANEITNGLKIWVASETPSTDTTVGLAWGAAKNTEETAIGSETTAPGYSFTYPANASEAGSGGDFVVGDYRALWIRYAISATNTIVFETFGISSSGSVSVPTNTSAPTISGIAAVGETLTATAGSWDHAPTSYSYQWQQSSDGLTGWSNITSASTIVLSEAQANAYVRVRVIANNDAGASSPAVSLASGLIASLVPSNISVPTISGTVKEGNALTTTTGSWLNTPTSYIYVWQVSPNGVNTWTTTGTNASTLVLGTSHVGKFIRSTVAATNSSGTASPANSAATVAVVTAAPANSSVPVVSGTQEVNYTLTSTTGTWTRSPTSYAYQWQVSDTGAGSWANIASASTSSTFLLTSSETSKYVRCVVTATNAGGSTAANSAATGSIVAATLGPELITNGDFSSGSGWTVVDSSTGVSGGVATITFGPGSNAHIYQQVTCSSGAMLRIVFTYISYSGASGLGYVRIGGFSGTDLQAPGTFTPQTYTFDVAAPSANPALYFMTYASSSESFVLDNVSVRVVKPSGGGGGGGGGDGGLTPVPGPYSLTESAISYFSGPVLGNHSLGNINIGQISSGGTENRALAYFRATQSSILSSARIFFTAVPPGYSAGNGGTIRMRVWPVDSSGYIPNRTGAHYGEATYVPGLISGNFPSGASEHQVYGFTLSGSAGALTAGTKYVIEFENLAADKYNNRISIDYFTAVPNAGISEDWISPGEWGAGINFGAGSSYENWGVSPGHLSTFWYPCMELHYANGQKFGFASVITGDIHDGTTDRITVLTAAAPGRARINLQTSRTIDGAYIYASARAGAAFNWALKSGATTLASGSANAVAQAFTSLIFTREYKHGRIHLDFGGVALSSGLTYDLELTPTGATELLLPANHDGRQGGYVHKFAYPEHVAQFWNGSAWVYASSNPVAYGTGTAIASYPIVLVDRRSSIPPVASIAPAITGAGSVGTSMTTTSGTWSGSPTYAYQWYRSLVEIISGATSTTYGLGTQDLPPPRLSYLSYDLYDGGLCPVVATQTGVRYVDPTLGNEANDGLTASTPWKYLSASRTVSNAVIYIKQPASGDTHNLTGVLGASASFISTPVLNNVTIRSEGENFIWIRKDGSGAMCYLTNDGFSNATDVTVYNIGGHGFGQAFYADYAITRIRFLRCKAKDQLAGAVADDTQKHGFYLGYNTGGVGPTDIEIAYCEGFNATAYRLGAFVQLYGDGAGVSSIAIHHCKVLGGKWTWALEQDRESTTNADIFNNTFSADFSNVIEFASYADAVGTFVDANYKVYNNILATTNASRVIVKISAGSHVPNLGANNTCYASAGTAVFSGTTLAAVGQERNPSLDASGIAANALEQGTGTPRESTSAWLGYDGKLPSSASNVDRGAYQYGTAGGTAGYVRTQVTATNSDGSASAYSNSVLVSAGASAHTMEQEGFRFYADGTESGSTALAAQDTNASAAVGAISQLRAIINTANGHTLRSFTLQAKKTADSVWTAVPVTSAVGSLPTYNAPGTAAANIIAISPVWPTHAIGDIGLLVCTTRGGETPTLSTASGFALLDSVGVGSGGTDGVRITVWWCRATTTSQAAPTIADSGDHQLARIWTVTGCIASGNPVNVSVTGTKTPASTVATAPAATTTVDNCLVVQIIAHDLDTAAASFTSEANATLATFTVRQDSGTTQGLGSGYVYCTGNLVSAGSTGGMTANVTSSQNASMTIALRPVETSPLLIAASASVTSGEATTARLTAPSGKTSGANFSAGKIVDTSSEVTEVAIANAGYTEIAWSIKTQSPAVAAEVYEFRVASNVGSVTYSVTPQLTLT